MTDLLVRPADPGDADAIWSMLQPVFTAGETYTVDPGIGRDGALSYWTTGKKVFVVARGNELLGTYYLVRNQKGGGSHVCNCGFVTAAAAQGLGVARLMLEHSLEMAKSDGFRAMQFNFVVANNTRAVEIWQRYGFDIVGRLPEAFHHPRDGYVDALVMYRKL
ncbi:N-acetyltransferase [Roseibium hamelinense]|nr:N-acetyltransferase [Roseibium hamelinense]MTI46111.1 N-acetyltransferase [Roseibium hamelinense]